MSDTKRTRPAGGDAARGADALGRGGQQHPVDPTSPPGATAATGAGATKPGLPSTDDAELSPSMKGSEDLTGDRQIDPGGAGSSRPPQEPPAERQGMDEAASPGTARSAGAAAGGTAQGEVDAAAGAGTPPDPRAESVRRRAEEAQDDSIAESFGKAIASPIRDNADKGTTR
jgi:hypothetical protein